MRIIRTLASTAVAAVAVITPLAVTGSAEASTAHPCVSKAEWRKIHKGMTRPQIKRLTGTYGTTTYTYTAGNGWEKDVDVEYRQCMPSGRRADSTLYMSFQNYEYGDEWTDWEDYWVPLNLSYKGGWGTPYVW